jgi:hypothetical protein
MSKFYLKEIRLANVFEIDEPEQEVLERHNLQDFVDD